MDRSKCRHDYVVMAVDALKTYMETSAAEGNTLQLIEEANQAIDRLQEIENGIVKDTELAKKTRRRQPKRVSLAIDEFMKKAKRLDPIRQEVQSFINNNEEAFSRIEELAEYIEVVRNTNRQLKRIKNSVERRFNDATHKKLGG